MFVLFSYLENGYIYHLTGPSRALFRSEELQVKRELLLKVAGKWRANKDNTGEDEYMYVLHTKGDLNCITVKQYNDFLFTVTVISFFIF